MTDMPSAGPPTGEFRSVPVEQTTKPRNRTEAALAARARPRLEWVPYPVAEAAPSPEQLSQQQIDAAIRRRAMFDANRRGFDSLEIMPGMPSRATQTTGLIIPAT